MEPLAILNKVCVENYDNGTAFTNKTRVDVIDNIIENSDYKLVCDSDIFRLYGKRDIKTGDDLVVVSTHVDCHPYIKKCYSSCCNGTVLCGTYDNAITNAAAVKIMLDNEISDNVFFAFTGDEEFNSAGAISLIKFFEKLNVTFRCIVLDVTDMGWNENASFTVENNFWGNYFGKKVIECAVKSGYKWKFVPSDPDFIPHFIAEEFIIPEEAEEDESWTYDENDIECFSLCLPCIGEMHSDKGVNVKLQSFYDYIEVLRLLLKSII